MTTLLLHWSTFKLTGVWLTHIKEFGIPRDYYHSHWFGLWCFRSSISIICCAAVDQNRLSKSTASEEKTELQFPYDTWLCKASLTTHTLSGYNSPWLTWHHDNIELQSVRSNHEDNLYWPGHTLANFKVGQKNWGNGLVNALSLSNSWEIPNHTMRHSESVS